MDLRHLRAVGEGLAVAGNARLVGLDHRRIAEDRFDRFSILTYGDSLPIFVSPELGEGETARDLQGIPVLRSKGHATQHGEQRNNRDGWRNVYALHIPLLRFDRCEGASPRPIRSADALGIGRASAEKRHASTHRPAALFM